MLPLCVQRNSLWADRGRNIFLLGILLLGSAGCSSLTSHVTSEKQIRREIKAGYAVTDTEFRNSMSHLLGAPLVEGNAITELQNGDQIFPAMLEAIRNAKTSITFEKYIWSSGEISTQFVQALAERARAGVKIHVIVDTLGGLKLKNKDIRSMTDAGVKFVRYNSPLSIKFFRINHRTHRKLMVVDGKIGFIGGVCLSDKWSGNAERGKWRDTHYRVEGPVVSQMQAVFCENWLETNSEVLHGRDYFPEIEIAVEIQSAQRTNSVTPGAQGADGSTLMAQCFASGPRDKAEQARLSYLLAMAAAKKNIRLAHAYFVPSKLAIETILDARKRGVKVEIIVPAKIDNFAVKMASRSRWGKLLDAGVEFHEYQPTLYHCKIMVVDDVWTTVGSVNFDEKSFRANDEANLNVLSPQFAAEITKTFEADKAKSRRLTRENYNNRSPFTKFFDFLFGRFHAEL